MPRIARPQAAMILQFFDESELEAAEFVLELVKDKLSRRRMNERSDDGKPKAGRRRRSSKTLYKTQEGRVVEGDLDTPETLPPVVHKRGRRKRASSTVPEPLDRQKSLIPEESDQAEGYEAPDVNP